MARNQRNRARAAAAAAAEHADEAAAPQQHNHNNDADSASDDDDNDANTARGFHDGGEKIGAKKRAKLEAKADKARQREAELAQREERKKRDDLAADERRQQDERERLEEQRQEQAEREARELKERQEHEEYLRMKAAFSVDEEGYDDTAGDDGTEAANLLQQFIGHIRSKKVVLLEDLSRAFKLKTPACIERIQELCAGGQLTGVLDDRGKFIYISEDELQAVAKFIRQRGRISIAELAESSNKLISMATAAAADGEAVC